MILRMFKSLNWLPVPHPSPSPISTPLTSPCFSHQLGKDSLLYQIPFQMTEVQSPTQAETPPPSQQQVTLTRRQESKLKPRNKTHSTKMNFKIITLTHNFPKPRCLAVSIRNKKKTAKEIYHQRPAILIQQASNISMQQKLRKNDVKSKFMKMIEVLRGNKSLKKIKKRKSKLKGNE